MSKDIKISITNTGFPDQNASDSEKNTKEFGLKVGKAIEYEWFRKDGNSARYYDRFSEYHRLRLYARGEQPVGKYKKELAVDGDLSYLNLDWTPVPIMPKFIDIVVNGMSDRLLSVKAFAVDALSAEKRSRYQEMVEGEMVAKELLMQVGEDFDVDPFSMNPDEVPDTEDELALHMQMKYKPAIEVAEEEAITAVMNENKFWDLKKRFDYDVTVLGLAVAKHIFLLGHGIKIEYVDPANVIHSYTEDPFFKDCFYWGEVKNIHITELKKIDPDLSKEDLEEISQYSVAWFDHFNLKQFHQNSPFTGDTVNVLFFNYKTTAKRVYKKKETSTGGTRVIERDDTFNPSPEEMEERGFGKIEREIDVWYEGVIVLGTNKVIQWRLMENMVRPKSTSQHALPNYVAIAPRMYKGSIESIGRRMIPFVDSIQLTHLKMQQISSRLVPDGVFIDADGLNEVDLGNGSTYNPEDALRLYFQTGSVVGRSFTGDGEFNHARVPIKELQNNAGLGKMQALIGNYNHFMGMIRDVTGLNEARDASNMDPNSLVGVQKLAALNSNTATRHILEAGIYMTRTMAEALTIRISDLMEYSDHAERLAMQIGKYNTALLDDIKELYLYDFGIFIEVTPDEEEKQRLDADIGIALERGDINLEDAIDIRALKNIKVANQLLKVRRVKKQQNDERQMMLQKKMEGEVNAQLQQAAAQAKQMEEEMRKNAKIEQARTEGEEKRATLQLEAELKAMLMEKEFMYNMQLKGIDVSNLMEKEKMKEDRKDQRVDKQSSQQSKLISQRKNNTPPVEFESKEDHMGGIGFGDIGISG